VTRPPSAWISRRTTSRPTPRPDRADTSSFEEKPGVKRRLSISPGLKRRAGRDQSLFLGDPAHLLPVDAGTVVGHLDDDAPGSMRRRKGDRTGFRLALRAALGGVLEAMVDGIPDHVGEGIDKPFDHGLVDLGRLTHRDEANLFPVASAASRMILCILWKTGFSGCARMAMTLSWMPEASCLIPSRPFDTSLSEARPALSTA
jgi:hypothetical protein